MIQRIEFYHNLRKNTKIVKSWRQRTEVSCKNRGFHCLSESLITFGEWQLFTGQNHTAYYRVFRVHDLAHSSQYCLEVHVTPKPVPTVPGALKRKYMDSWLTVLVNSGSPLECLHDPRTAQSLSGETENRGEWNKLSSNTSWAEGPTSSIKVCLM